MLTIEEINKAFDKLWHNDWKYVVGICIKRNPETIKSFYTQQILSLIEELGKKLIGKDDRPKNLYDITDWERTRNQHRQEQRTKLNEIIKSLTK